jgi:hypothetical protein
VKMLTVRLIRQGEHYMHQGNPSVSPAAVV